MPVIHCPTCDHAIQLVVEPVAKLNDSTPLNDPALRAVLEFMRANPGRHASTEFWMKYLNETIQQEGWPDLTMNAFARALKRNGATRWRNAKQRGFVIPEIPEDREPGRPSRTERERNYRELEREIAEDHSRDIVSYPWPDGSFRRTPPPGVEEVTVEELELRQRGKSKNSEFDPEFPFGRPSQP